MKYQSDIFINTNYIHVYIVYYNIGVNGKLAMTTILMPMFGVNVNKYYLSTRNVGNNDKTMAVTIRYWTQ